MRNLINATVTAVHHWSETLFSFKITREPSFRFENGQFVMIGLEVDGKPLLRAYSIASPNYEDELEFFSIKVPNGALTSRLQNVKPGDNIMMSIRPAGTLVAGHLLPGKRLFLLATGTGLAPFLSIIKDPFLYENFEKIILVHGTRFASELAYQQEIETELPQNPYFGEDVKEKLLYYPSITREPYEYNSLKKVDGLCSHRGRITTLLETGKLVKDLELPPLSPESDRFMLCGNDAMLADLSNWLTSQGFSKATSRMQGHFVIEQAFLER
ncbi:ferredoxin--NADP reductase [Alteromonas pelagimontana]|uniref:ferredoxin--NADP(+) reductase n=1 Tax=Alteromonas pelagimontana TaxID=1858656 RepID=A0A6M4MHZ1_9ALTE|nr:ferredoxin--NADP reductase [Alteromonas pelagimontana]QJR82637.1 ferredoxin--NADP reductase [Alteromonas pelagimontana]